MKILPSEPSAALTSTERKVFNLVKQVEWGNDSIALSSVNLSEHEYKRWGELDFVIVAEYGLFAIEVKGGDVSCADGVWRYRTAQGTVTRKESPFAQVGGSFFSLEKQLSSPECGLELQAPVPGGFCVVFAGMGKKELAGIVGGPEMPVAIAGTAGDIADAESFRRFLTRVAQHWRDHANKAPKSWTASQVKKVAQYLRPDFDRAVPMGLRLKAVREERVRFTEEQYELLDFLDTYPRLFITGGAGCGKTFIGMEVARREATAGNRVLFLTGTESLARFIREEGSLPASVIVHSMHELKAAQADEPPFDVLIVDEGQQITTAAAWATIDPLVKGGMEAGRWRWFGDYMRQVSLDSMVEEPTFELLRMMSTHQRLIHNCRNTPQLIKAAENISGRKIGRALVRGAGPELAWVIGRSRSEIISGAAKQLLKWLTQDIPADSVVQLHANDYGRQLATEVCQAAGVGSNDWHDAYMKPRRKAAVPHASIRDFRGLESEHVQIFGLDKIEDSAELRTLAYIAITRANFGAAIVGTPALQHRIMDLCLPGVASIAGA